MKKVAVVGGGISGLATAYEIDKRLRASGGHYELRLFEAEARVGGKIGAARRDGFVCEAGPNGFLDSKPSTLNLCRELGIEDQLLRSSDAAARRFIFSRGQLHQLPGSPLAFFRSRLLSLPARLRIVGELWAPVSPPGSDPTVAEFGRRRLGRQAAARLLDPMVAGVFAGDPERLSLGSCFPRIAELEREFADLEEVAESFGSALNPLGFEEDFLVLLNKRQGQTGEFFDTFNILRERLEVLGEHPGELLRLPVVRRRVEALSGTVLVALGARVAVEA